MRTIYEPPIIRQVQISHINTIMTSNTSPSPGSGVAEIKEKMSKIKLETEKWNTNADRLEKEKEQTEERCEASSKKQMELLVKCTDTENKLRKTEEKLKVLTQQVNDAEIFLKESEKFQTFLNDTSPDEKELMDQSENLKTQKENYILNEKKCRKAEKRKVKLTRLNEAANTRLKETLGKIEALKLELEYRCIDEARKTASTNKQLRNTNEIKSDLIELDQTMKNVAKRKTDAHTKIVASRQRIQELELMIEEVHGNRLKAQKKAKELALYIRARRTTSCDL